MNNREDVLAALGQHQQALQRFGVRRLGLFGSIARNEGRPDSDLDFVVELEHHTFDSYMDLKFFLEKLFGCRVDLVLAGAIKPRLRERIAKDTVHVPGLDI